MTPNDKLLASIFGPRNSDEAKELAAEAAEAERERARALAEIAAEACPEWAPVAPALLWGAPAAVAVVKGQLVQLSRFSGEWDYSPLEEFDIRNLEEL